MNKELYNTITQLFERYFSNLQNEIIFHEEVRDAWIRDYDNPDFTIIEIQDERIEEHTKEIDRLTKELENANRLLSEFKEMYGNE